jgi:hypothetical protein
MSERARGRRGADAHEEVRDRVADEDVDEAARVHDPARAAVVRGRAVDGEREEEDLERENRHPHRPVARGDAVRDAERQAGHGVARRADLAERVHVDRQRRAERGREGDAEGHEQVLVQVVESVDAELQRDWDGNQTTRKQSLECAYSG